MSSSTFSEFSPQPAATREFPASAPAGLGAQGISLESLVHHRFSVESSLPLELAQRTFRQRNVEFMAMTDRGRVVGLCARGRLGFIMSSRFGFALYSQQPIATVAIEQPLIVERTTLVLDLLDRALRRKGDAFHEDVVLVSDSGALIGLIKAETLAHLQSRLVQEQMEELRRQHDTLRRRNLDLFQASHAARQSQGLYLSLFNSHSLGIALVDREGLIHEHNQRLAELLNLDSGSLAVASLTAWIVERDRAPFLAVLESRAAGHAAGAHEFTLDVPGRGSRLFRFSSGWIRETGQACVFIEDVTEQRALERNVMRQEKQILLDTLVGGIAHELNNKLTPIQGFAELLSLEAGGRSQSYAEMIATSVGEAARIIRQLLEMSKPATHDPQMLDLRTIVEEALVMLKFQIREAACKILTVLPPAPVFVSADAGQLKQVALNLFINALHAMEQSPRRELTIEVRNGGPEALFIVTDSGCGIPGENLNRIFDPFFTTKGPERGTGLGLSICYSLVRQHGGEIRVASDPGAGATFTVSFPIQVGAPSLFPLEDSRAAETRLDLPRAGRVLVVEDEVVLRRLMQEILCSRFSCQVDLAGNGAEALALIERHHYALVLSDIRMPEMDGPGLYLRLRDLRPRLARRMVFITGHPGDKHLEAEIEQWNIPVIAKPFSLTRLGEVCRPYLELEATA